MVHRFEFDLCMFSVTFVNLQSGELSQPPMQWSVSVTFRDVRIMILFSTDPTLFRVRPALQSRRPRVPRDRRRGSSPPVPGWQRGHLLRVLLRDEPGGAVGPGPRTGPRLWLRPLLRPRPSGPPLPSLLRPGPRPSTQQSNTDNKNQTFL